MQQASAEPGLQVSLVLAQFAPARQPVAFPTAAGFAFEDTPANTLFMQNFQKYLIN